MANKRKIKRTFYLSDSVVRELLAEAKNEKRSFSEIVREALEVRYSIISRYVCRKLRDRLSRIKEDRDILFYAVCFQNKSNLSTDVLEVLDRLRPILLGGVNGKK